MIKLEQTLIVLAQNQVDFVIVGGVAATLHGSARATFDLDLCYSREGVNLTRLADALTPFRPKLRDVPGDLPFLWDAGTLRNGLNFTLSTDLGDLDLLAEIPGLGGFSQVKDASVPVDLFGLPFLVLTLEGLISARKAAGRPKDLTSLAELEALREAAS
jgi:hypothetical protein